MASVDYISFAFAALVATGGLVGYLKSASIVSLISGVGSGALLAYGAYQVSYYNNCSVLLGTSCILAVLMGFRFYTSQKFMPAGLVFILSALMILRCGVKLIV
jgi:uncharacterized membrane protein (UPF0136 family)